MTKRAVPIAVGDPLTPVCDILPAGESLPESGLHFAAPGFAEQPALPAFAAMPETMPPPPVRPVLPPDLTADPEKPGLIARLLGGLSS